MTRDGTTGPAEAYADVFSRTAEALKQLERALDDHARGTLTWGKVGDVEQVLWSLMEWVRFLERGKRSGPTDMGGNPLVGHP